MGKTLVFPIFFGTFLVLLRENFFEKKFSLKLLFKKLLYRALRRGRKVETFSSTASYIKVLERGLGETFFKRFPPNVCRFQ